MPKELGKLVNLKEFYVSSNKIEGQLSIRTELHQLASNLTLSCTGVIPAELRQLVNLTQLWLQGNQLTGESSAPVLSGSACFVDLDQNCVASGRVPKKLANLANLTRLYLHGNKEIQVPEGAPLHFSGEIAYESREAVAAFQACLK